MRNVMIRFCRVVQCAVLCCCSLFVKVGYGEEALLPYQLEDTFKLGFASAPTSFDPHAQNIYSNIALHYHANETLFSTSIENVLTPLLAESYELIDPLTWRIRLKKGVLFHDGTPFTSKDVIYSFDRIIQSQLEKNEFEEYVKSMASYEAEDAYTLLIKTHYPHAYLLHNLSTVFIVKHDDAISAADNTIDVNKVGESVMVGTGPYQYVDMTTPDLENVAFKRFESYHGDKPDFKSVRVISIKDRQERTTAFLAGQLHAIEKVIPPEMIEMRKNKAFKISEAESLRLIYLHMDSGRDQSPYVTDNMGQPLKKNPLQDVRVRRAIMSAIDKREITENIIFASQPTTQLVPLSSHTSSPNLAVLPRNLDKAKSLLVEAGYPDGFNLVLHTPNDRYIKDKEVALAIADMLTEAGINTSVIDMPKKEYFPKLLDKKFSFMLVGWRTRDGRVSNVLEPLLMTPNKETGEGLYNEGGYSNKALDAIIIEAREEFDPRKKLNLVRHATEVAIKDVGIIPLFFEPSIWVYRSELSHDSDLTFSTFCAQAFSYVGTQ